MTSYQDDQYRYSYDEEADGYNEDEFVMFNARETYADDSTDVSSVSTNRKKQRKYQDDHKTIDRGYHKIKIGDNTHVDVYSTGDAPGTLVRDAVTGSRFKEFKVGSNYEHLFFKAKLTVGLKNNESATLFFDSPEQFERILKTNVSQPDKEKWTNKCSEIKNRYAN